MRDIDKVNNFDLVRILAALQVVFMHSILHLEIKNPILLNLHSYLIKYFPGVPIFFCVSGFLIFWSFERNKNHIKRFFRFRFLRLYPGLWICLFINLILILAHFQDNLINFNNLIKLSIWFLGQATFFQFYTPDLLRFYGVGTPNGSLWTIVIEIQYYLFVPLLYYLLLKNNKYLYLKCFTIILLSILINIFVGRYDEELMIRKLGSIFIGSYLYYFMFGALAYISWDKIYQIFEDKLFYWLLTYIIFFLFFGDYQGIYVASYWIHSWHNLIAHVLLACLTLSFAFSYRNISDKVLKGNDISYGVYIYHMLIINYFVHHNYLYKTNYLILVFFITIIIAYLSWVFVEKKALSLKYLKMKASK